MVPPAGGGLFFPPNQALLVLSWQRLRDCQPRCSPRPGPISGPKRERRARRHAKKTSYWSAGLYPATAGKPLRPPPPPHWRRSAPLPPHASRAVSHHQLLVGLPGRIHENSRSLNPRHGGVNSGTVGHVVGHVVTLAPATAIKRHWILAPQRKPQAGWEYQKGMRGRGRECGSLLSMHGKA